MTKHLLVLGGTGLVGSNVCRVAVEKGWKVTSLTRRGKPDEHSDAFSLMDAVDWRAGDASNARLVLMLVKEVAPDAIVHCIGVLFDCKSMLVGMNKVVSGCQSVPDPSKGTYENIIKNTAMSAFHAIALLNKNELPFIFVSVVEAGWAVGDNGCLARGVRKVVPPFLGQYLTAKEDVEAAMLYGKGVPEICKRRGNAARPVVIRPSLVVSDDRPRCVTSTLAKVASLTPFSDPPLHASTLALAVLKAACDSNVAGVYRNKDIHKLAKEF